MRFSLPDHLGRNTEMRDRETGLSTAISATAVPKLAGLAALLRATVDSAV
jgi:hypothetical protein